MAFTASGRGFVVAGGSGTVTTLLAAVSAPNGPYGLTFDALGNLYLINHASGAVYRYDFANPLQQIASVTALGGTFTEIGFAGKNNPPFIGPAGNHPQFTPRPPPWMPRGYACSG